VTPIFLCIPIYQSSLREIRISLYKSKHDPGASLCVCVCVCVCVCTPGLGKGERVRRASAYSKNEKKEGLRCLLHLHLQGAQAGAPRHTPRHISSKLISDIFYKIANEAGKVVRCNKKGTLTSREIQTAVRLALPAQLAKPHVSEGTSERDSERDRERVCVCVRV
jgi:hypothetical protein